MRRNPRGEDEHLVFRLQNGARVSIDAKSGTGTMSVIVGQFCDHRCPS